jgi:DNA recombination protein RmuC
MLSRGTTSDPARNTSPARGVAFSQTPIGIITFVTAAFAVLAITVALWLKHRTKEDTARRDEERVRMEVTLAEARTREDAANLERAQLEASLYATREAAEAQRAALQQLSSELGDRLLQQQASAFQATTAALERRASSESEAIRTAYEAATAERNERLHVELQPVHETLMRLADTTVATDTRSTTEFTRLVTLVQGLNDEHRAHREETRKLQDTLRVSQVRGRYGEWTLQRALEAAGLQEKVHYVMQPAMRDEDGLFRPDAVLLLPQGRAIVVDSKAPLQHLLDAQHATSESEKNALLDRHAKALRGHVDQLANKGYPARMAAVVQDRVLLDGVLLFVPADAVLEAAYRRDPKLLQHAAAQRVHLVSPATLLIVLSAVEQLWRQDGRDQRAAEIEKIGEDLLGRVGVVLGHVANVQSSLSACVEAYNALTSSLESRLLPIARRMEEMGVRARDPMPAIGAIDLVPRELGPRLSRVLLNTPANVVTTPVAASDTPAAA